MELIKFNVRFEIKYANVLNIKKKKRERATIPALSWVPHRQKQEGKGMRESNQRKPDQLFWSGD